MSPLLSLLHSISRRRSTHTPSIFVPSAKYRTLEETAALFDGLGAKPESEKADLSDFNALRPSEVKRDDSSTGSRSAGEKGEKTEVQHIERV